MRLETFIQRDARELPHELDAKESVRERRLLVLFGASSMADDPRRLERLIAASDASVVIGCSTSGEIFGTHVEDETVVGAVADFERSDLRFASASVPSPGDSERAGRELARALNAPDLRAVFILSDGLNVNGSELIRGVNQVLPASVVVTGGLAGDGDKFQRTWVLREGRPVSHEITAVGFYGENVCVGHGSMGGWDLFGPERVVTRSVGNVVYELDHEPALQLYKSYLGDRASGLPATGLLFPLSIRVGATVTARLVRTILAVDEASQSLTFAGDVPQGSFAQLMHANFDRLVQGAYDAAASVTSDVAVVGDRLALAISCVGRRLVLGERTEEEIEATLEVLPAHTRQIGFYSYGELSPNGVSRCDLHNQTMTLTTLGER